MAFPEGWFDTVTFNRNRDLFPEEQLQQYWGRHVAWSLDGTRILADGATPQALDECMRVRGIDPLATVDDFIPDPAVSYI